jgi:large subunit ribosomal protein L30e
MVEKEDLEAAKQEMVDEVSDEEAEAELAAEEAKKREPKKAVRRRKSKKEKESPLASALRLAVESGEVEFGSKSALVNSKKGDAKLFVLAANAPSATRDQVLKQVKAKSLSLIEFEGSSLELGSVCGKPYPVAVLSVHKAGTSNILDLAKKK